ncbi:tyrosine-protein phosphatase [Lapillicoccus sp.]|uniref:tyrosine-protein phosphatase n=1 Tax=Lapillicoccus sp. TaxID=1909287 RepID=UPI0032637377
MTTDAHRPASTVPAWIELDGVVNMRDVGGLPTTDGGTIASGRLIRSDNLQELSPAAVRHLVDELGLTDVVDLRTHVEVAKEGDGPLVAEPRVTIHHHTLYTEDTVQTGIPTTERALPWVRDPMVGDDRRDQEVQRVAAERPEHEAFWSQHYLGYLANRPDSVVAALRTIADAPGAVVVHCAAGKDRTGTIVGVALSLAGAADDAVVADFELSAERVPQILERLRRREAYAANLVGKTVDEQSPRGETMRRLLAALRAAGGAEQVLTAAGWTSGDTSRLQARLRR